MQVQKLWLLLGGASRLGGPRPLDAKANDVEGARYALLVEG
ncbi:hypothetical protein [Roseateles sp. P5_E11]